MTFLAQTLSSTLLFFAQSLHLMPASLRANLEATTSKDTESLPLTHQQLFAYLVQRYESNPRLDAFDMAEYCVNHHAPALQEFIDQEYRRYQTTPRTCSKADDAANPNTTSRPNRDTLHLTMPSVAIDMVEAALMAAAARKK